MYQNNYGKEAAAKNMTNSFVKLPTKLFRDYTVAGPLTLIFKVLLKAIDKNQWSDLNILREDRKEILKSVLDDIEKILVEKKFLVWPRIKFSSGKLLVSFCFLSLQLGITLSHERFISFSLILLTNPSNIYS